MNFLFTPMSIILSKLSFLVIRICSFHRWFYKTLLMQHLIGSSSTCIISISRVLLISPCIGKFIHWIQLWLTYLSINLIVHLNWIVQSISSMDGRYFVRQVSIFNCPSSLLRLLLVHIDLSNDSIYQYFVDNQKTSGHRSIVFGLRELNCTEMIDYCSNVSINHPPISNERANLTANYELRIYTSGCYYLDQSNTWKSDGVRVGLLTNFDQTQCFSTHLTEFTGGLRVLPSPINWSYVFANADFMKNKTIYVTVICVSTIYIILIIYARWKDRKDLEKLGVTPLPDNHKADRYMYQLIVFTGQRKDAGTKSKVTSSTTMDSISSMIV